LLSGTSPGLNTFDPLVIVVSSAAWMTLYADIVCL
jgi:hypothetical protein